MSGRYALVSRMRNGAIVSWALAWVLACGFAMGVLWYELGESFDSKLQETAQLLLSIAARAPGGLSAADGGDARARTGVDSIALITFRPFKDIAAVTARKSVSARSAHNQITAARVSYERVTARRESRLYSEAALDAERKKLENGKSTSFVVLQLQKDLTAARSAEIGALADYNKALADLARSEGSTLERRAINLQVQ